MKGMRDKDGNPLPNAHLQVSFDYLLFVLVYALLFFSFLVSFAFLWIICHAHQSSECFSYVVIAHPSALLSRPK